MYKIYLISSKGYKNAGVHILIMKKTGEIWVSMKNVHDGLGVKNMSDLVLKEIHGICETKSPTKEQVKKYADLSEEKLSTKSSKTFMSKMMSWVHWEIDGLRKKSMIPKFKIPECPEHEVKWKIGIIFVN